MMSLVTSARYLVQSIKEFTDVLFLQCLKEKIELVEYKYEINMTLPL